MAQHLASGLNTEAASKLSPSLGLRQTQARAQGLSLGLGRNLSMVLVRAQGLSQIQVQGQSRRLKRCGLKGGAPLKDELIA